ncbi:MAG TPA: trypsin-like peptidase domain-containing protein [Burkholderiales bacterium]|nr:trypsin-like peptidase domain-containing protein [Burkholderiales bacterium]
MNRFASRIFSLACCTAWMPAGALTPDAFYSKTAPSVWLVKTFDEDGLALSVGSAVVIAPDTVLTNCHVLAKAKRVSVRQENTSHNAKLQYADVERDLCQLTVAGLGAPAVPVGDSDKMAVGQHVFALGNPKGLELTLSDGLVSALRRDDKGHLVLIQTTAPISQGSSGGGLFDENGKLIGITSLLAREGQNLNFAFPINWLSELSERSAAAMKKRQEEKAARGDAPAAPPVPSGSRPQPSGYAEIGEVEKVPVSYRGKESYLVFLGKPYPRAFVIGERGAWGFAWGVQVKNDPNASPDPAVRALQFCEKRQQRCVVYAIDDVVVYQRQFKPLPAAQSSGPDEGK